MRPLESAAPQGSEEPVMYEIARQRARGAIRAAKRLESNVLPVSADQISRSSARAFSKLIDQATLENHDVPEPKRSRVRAAAERKVQELTGALDYALRLRHVPLVRRDLEQLRLDLDNPTRVAQASRTFYAAGHEIAGTETRSALTERTPVDLGYAHVGALREAQARRHPKYAARKAAQSNIDVLHTHLDIDTGCGRTPRWREIITIFAGHAAILNAACRRSEALRLKSLIENIEHNALRKSILVHFRTTVEVPFAEDFAKPTVAHRLKLKCRKSFRTLRRHYQAAVLRLKPLGGLPTPGLDTLANNFSHLGANGYERGASADVNRSNAIFGNSQRAELHRSGEPQLREEHDLFDPIYATVTAGAPPERGRRPSAMAIVGLAERLRADPMNTLVSVIESHFAHVHQPVLLTLPTEHIIHIPEFDLARAGSSESEASAASDAREVLGYPELLPESQHAAPNSSPASERAQDDFALPSNMPGLRSVEQPPGI